MINLNLESEFKSLEPFQIELPDFVVLSGLNGAGKTQILQSIQNAYASISDEGYHSDFSKYVNPLSLAPNDPIPTLKSEFTSIIQDSWSKFDYYLRVKKRNSEVTFEDHYKNSLHEISIITKISEIAKKSINDLNSEDFSNYYPMDFDLTNIDLFDQNFSNLFRRYLDRYEDNKYSLFKFKEGDKNSTFLSEKDFISNFGEAPWKFINKIFKEADLDYEIHIPTNFNRDIPFELKLVNKINKAQIKFSDLSSGEKVLVSLALAIYNTSFDISVPEILLMDEPDASLHPSMSKKLINVIQEVFVKQKGIKVIMTTHSPSTVALTPEENLYVVNKHTPRIEKVSKDCVLGILMSGVPSISINYENRRQIFVESKNDVLFYDKIYRRLHKYLQPEISLSFISSGDSRKDKNGIKVSSCDQVINITTTLRNSGNKQVWGIIDYDLKNTSDNYIKVLGRGNRYSIESYIFDTILLAALLLRVKIISRKELGLNDDENYTDFKYLTVEKLQFISDFIISSVSDKFDTSNEKKLIVKYINDKEILVPNWYLHCNGHELEDKILKTFPKLNSIKRDQEEKLKLEIIDKIIDDIPTLLSIDLLEVFKHIQQQ